jgi:hypothetical protein
MKESGGGGGGGGGGGTDVASVAGVHRAPPLLRRSALKSAQRTRVSRLVRVQMGLGEFTALPAHTRTPDPQSSAGRAEAVSDANAGRAEPVSDANAGRAEPVSDANGRAEPVSDANACVICFERAKSHAFAQCFHKCVCAVCAAAIKAGPSERWLCPICRTPGDARQVYE